MSGSAEPSAGSVSKIECKATFRGGGEAKIALYRHLAPLTINALLRTMPLDSRVNIQPPLACLFAELRVGVEKAKGQYARGDVAFLPSGGLICVFLGDARSDRPLNPLGKVEEGMELFEGLKPGDVVRLSALQAGAPSGTG